MNASPKVLVIIHETTFKELDGSLVLLLLFVDHSQIEIGVDIGNWLLDCPFIEVYCFFKISFFLINSPEGN